MSKKMKMMRLCAVMIIIITAISAYLLNSKQSKTKMIELAVADCVKNLPFNQTWLAHIEQLGVTEHNDKFTQYFCQCTTGDMLEAIPEETLQTFRQLSPQKRIQKLGGFEAMHQKEQACLKSWQKSTF